jgi:hypothetical protein
MEHKKIDSIAQRSTFAIFLDQLKAGNLIAESPSDIPKKRLAEMKLSIQKSKELH